MLNTSTAITIAGITCWDEDVQESYGKGNVTADRVLLCAWEDRQRLIDALIGGSEIINGLTVEIDPVPYPDNSALQFESADVKGVHGAGGTLTGTKGQVAYKYARITAHYTVPKMTVLGQPYYTSVDVAQQTIAAPTGGPILTWSDDTPIPASDCQSIPVTVITFEKVRFSLPQLPVATLISWADTVNSAPFEGAAAGKVRFVGARSQVRHNGSRRNFDLTCIFAFRNVEWTKMWRPKGTHGAGGWDSVKRIYDGAAMFSGVDYNALFAKVTGA